MRFKLNKRGVSDYFKTIQKRFDTVQEKVLELNLNNLKKNTPVKTGYMLSRYYIEDFQILNDTEYFWYVNNGTRFRAGQHFVQLSIAETKSQIPMIFNQAKKIN